MLTYTLIIRHAKKHITLIPPLSQCMAHFRSTVLTFCTLYVLLELCTERSSKAKFHIYCSAQCSHASPCTRTHNLSPPTSTPAYQYPKLFWNQRYVNYFNSYQARTELRPITTHHHQSPDLHSSKVKHWIRSTLRAQEQAHSLHDI